jgi:hypothetical protein
MLKLITGNTETAPTVDVKFSVDSEGDIGVYYDDVWVGYFSSTEGAFHTCYVAREYRETLGTKGIAFTDMTAFGGGTILHD